MDLDLKDKKLIHLLEKDSRTNVLTLSKELQLSRDSVQNRMKKLENKGIIKKYVTLTNFIMLGYTHIAMYLKIKNSSPKIEKEILDYIKEKEYIVWAATLGGKYDLVFESIAKSFQDFNDIQNKFLHNFHNNIANIEIAIRTNQSAFPRKYIYDNNEIVCNENIKNIKSYNLDETDKIILSLLRDNSRLENIKISEKLNIPVKTVSYKIKNMIKHNIIKCNTIFVDPKKIGYQSFETFIYATDFSEKFEKKIYEYAKEHPNIYYFVKCIGKWNYEFEIDAKDLAEYQSILQDFRDKFKIVKDIEFVAIFNEEKFTF
jgi:Lrp/AsnC family transcriptional regulator, leucine-responsive regulatory protein